MADMESGIRYSSFDRLGVGRSSELRVAFKLGANAFEDYLYEFNRFHIKAI